MGANLANIYCIANQKNIFLYYGKRSIGKKYPFANVFFLPFDLDFSAILAIFYLLVLVNIRIARGKSMGKRFSRSGGGKTLPEHIYNSHYDKGAAGYVYVLHSG